MDSNQNLNHSVQITTSNSITEIQHDPLRRFSSRFIDTQMLSIIWCLALVGCFFVIYLLFRGVDSIKYNSSFGWLIVALPMMLITILVFLYYPIMNAIFGQTLGDKVNSIKITKLDGQKPEFWRICLRVLLNIIDSQTLFLAIGSIFTVYLREDKKSLYDLICQTKVVEYKTQPNLTFKSIMTCIGLLVLTLILVFVGVVTLINYQAFGLFD